MLSQECIPHSLWPSFQEYDPHSLNLKRDADLILQPPTLRSEVQDR